MSLNRLLGRASSFTKFARSDSCGIVLNRVGLSPRHLSSLSPALINFRICSSSLSNSKPSHLNYVPPFKYVYRSCISNRNQYNLLLSKEFSSQPSPKPGTSSVGLADQVLRSSATREEKQAEKASDTPEDEKAKEKEKQVRAVKFTLIALGGIMIGTAVYIFFEYGAPLLDRNGNPIRDEFSDLPFVQQYWKRGMAELSGMVTMVTNPSREQLLPDPVKPPYHQPPYTLLIELTGILVHPDWTYKTGWRFKKRPGVDYFLNQLNGYLFEVVIYTSELGFTAFPIIDALDTQNVVHYRLFRDSTKYDNGIHVKDLDKINRDLSKVIAIDWNDKALHNHRNNALVLPRWKGNDDDRALFDLAALLQTIGSSGIEDVRGVLEYYSKFDDPIAEFRKKQQELAQKEKEMNTDKIATPTFSPASGWLGSLFKKN
ncbi:unnamed protein product [Orchesella dallaii]|uniref:Mitochondrial import inner membrane translocase subunit TIM50 n=1 Tax=Orchesella dallaii TaxID=48710 RepID=A0ABP1RTE7_9HEXA